MPTATLVYFDLSATFTDWRSLFVSYYSESFSVASTAIKLSLDMQVYEGIKADLLAAIESQIAKHIKTQSVNFGTKAAGRRLASRAGMGSRPLVFS